MDFFIFFVFREDRLSIGDGKRNRIIDDGESTLRTVKSFDSASVTDAHLSGHSSREVLNGWLLTFLGLIF